MGTVFLIRRSKNEQTCRLLPSLQQVQHEPQQSESSKEDIFQSRKIILLVFSSQSYSTAAYSKKETYHSYRDVSNVRNEPGHFTSVMVLDVLIKTATYPCTLPTTCFPSSHWDPLYSSRSSTGLLSPFVRRSCPLIESPNFGAVSGWVSITL